VSNRMLAAPSSREGRALVAGSVLGLPAGRGSGCGDHLSVAAAVLAGRLARSVAAAQGGGLPSVKAPALSVSCFTTPVFTTPVLKLGGQHHAGAEL
jgi:hypothetical protein